MGAGCKDAIPALRRALEDKSPKVRQAARLSTWALFHSSFSTASCGSGAGTLPVGSDALGIPSFWPP
jgi:hypothetical protein